MQNVSKCTLSISKVTQWVFSGHTKESTLRIAFMVLATIGTFSPL